MSDYFQDISAWLIFTTFRLYSYFTEIFINCFFSKTKESTDKVFAKRGIKVGGSAPQDIIVLDKKQFYKKVIIDRFLGLAEGYMEGVWTTKDLKSFLTTFLPKVKWNSVSRNSLKDSHPLNRWIEALNLQTKTKSFEVGVKHYDIGNDIYEQMLGKHMQYSCGYWKTAKDLDSAQFAKMELIAQKLKLKPGMKVLDIGCGFGTLAHHLAKNHGVSVVGCSISKEQTKYGRKLCEADGFKLPVEFRFCDYRDINEQFDRIVSVGMFEHVGKSNYKEFFTVANNCLSNDGIFLLHTIGNNHKTQSGFDMWFHKYIFPNGMFPYYRTMCKAMEGLFVIEDWHNFGTDYTKTLEAWEKKFDTAWENNLSAKYGETFYKMWKFYLTTCQVLFSNRSTQLWQVVLSKNGVAGGYESVR